MAGRQLERGLYQAEPGKVRRDSRPAEGFSINTLPLKGHLLYFPEDYYHISPCDGPNVA